MSKRQIYNIAISEITKPGQVIVMDNCNGFTFVNDGQTIAYVNGMPLYPGNPAPAPPPNFLGDAWEIGGNEGEEYKGLINVRFDGVGNDKLIVVQKNYTN